MRPRRPWLAAGLRVLALAGVLVRAALGQAVPGAASQAFQFPNVKTHMLSNGLRLLVVEDHAAQVVAVRGVLGVDDTFDPPGKEGLNQVMLGALREGTTTRSADQLADASARIGTAVAPTAFTTVPASFEPALALMGDMLMHPSFDSAGIERRKAAQAQTFRSTAQRPFTPARQLFYSSLENADDPVVRGQGADPRSVLAIRREDVQNFYNAHVGPSTLTLIVVGDVTDASAVAAATRAFGTWAKPATARRPSVPLKAPRPTTIYLRDVPGATTYLYVGSMGPSRTSPDAFAADMLSAIASTRLMATLREQRSFVYSGTVGITWRPAPRPSEFVGSTTLTPTKADSALVEWMALLRGLRGASPVSDAELRTAIAARVGPLWTRTDGPDSVASRIAEAVRDNLAPDFLAKYAAGISAVTPTDIAAAASKYIDADHLVIVVTGDRKILEPALRAANIAPVVIVGADRP